MGLYSSVIYTFLFKREHGTQKGTTGVSFRDVVVASAKICFFVLQIDSVVRECRKVKLQRLHECDCASYRGYSQTIQLKSFSLHGYFESIETC